MRTARYILFLVLLLAGLTWLAGRHWLTGTPVDMPELAGTLDRHDFESGGVSRSFIYYVPKRLAADRPVVFAFHSSAGHGERMRTATAYAFDVLADRDGFIVVYPDGFDGNWNDCRTRGDTAARRRGIDDVAFVRDVLAFLDRQFPGEPGPVFVLGLSNGGQLALRLAMEAPDMIDAAAAIAANLPAPDNLVCNPSGRPVAVLLINGTDDPINPYEGGEVVLLGVFGSRGNVLGAEASAAWWAENAGHEGEPFRHRYPDANADDGSVADRIVWRGGGRPEVGLITVRGGGHTIPHPDYRMPRILGGTNRDFAAADEIWRFFRRQVPGDPGT